MAAVVGRTLVRAARSLGSFGGVSHAAQVKHVHRISCGAVLNDRYITGRNYSCGTPEHPIGYEEAFRRARDSPEEFWAEAAEDLVWTKKWTKVMDNSNPPFTKWFVGGELNTCYNALDRHVNDGFGEQTAIIYDSPYTKYNSKVSYKELQRRVSLFAGVLSKHGVKKGDTVLLYMPMIPTAIVAMLATARLGAIHSLVFGGFGSKELATRINHAKPKAIVTANCGMEPNRIIEYKPLLDAAIEYSDYKPPVVLVHTRTSRNVEFPLAKMVPGRDFSWNEELETAKPHDCVPVGAMDPIYLLYTSGTTGTPKGVVRPSGGHAVILKWTMWNLYGMKPHETWLAASDLGWVVGHSYITYAPLLNCNTTVLYEGKPVGTPDAGAFFRMISDYNITTMFTAPTAMRAIRREDPQGEYMRKYPLKTEGKDRFRSLFVAGEHCDGETMEWMRHNLKVPVLDHWWQTETGFAITSPCMGLGTDPAPPPGVAGPPVPGWNVDVLNDQGKSTEVAELGRIVVKQPLPPGSFSTLWKNDEKFANLYFTTYPGYYDTMDAGFRDRFGNIAVMSRADDVINVAGHRLSSGGLEEAILEHQDIAEAAVVGMPDKLKGQIPIGLCVLKTGVDKPHDKIMEEVIATVRELIGPVAFFKKSMVVEKLPKTRSGKVARNTMASKLAGEPYVIPVTIDDPTVYPQLEEVFRKHGYKPTPTPAFPGHHANKQ